MSVIITIAIVAWLIFILFFSASAKRKQAELDASIQKISDGLNLLKNEPDNQDLYNQVLSAWQDKRLSFFLAVEKGWLKKAIELCELYPENSNTWLILSDFRDRNILNDKKISHDVFNVCHAGLLKVFRDKKLRDFIISIADKVVGLSTDLVAKNAQMYEDLYQAALRDLEVCQPSDELAAKVVALDVGRIMYRGIITMQDEQKIQNDIFVRLKK